MRGSFKQHGPTNLIGISRLNNAVSEPAILVMMIAGFGVIGASMRRRQNVRVRVA